MTITDTHADHIHYVSPPESDHHELVGVGTEQPPQTPARHVAETIVEPSEFVGAKDRSLFKMTADSVDELEALRIAMTNRLNQFTRTARDKDGALRGLGLPPHHPAVLRIAHMVEQLKVMEDKTVASLAELMREHPLGPWVRTQTGIGDKQMARLLAAVGDPYIRPPMKSADGQTRDPARVRTLAELRGYCGLGVVQIEGAGAAPRKRRGERVHWDPIARMRLRLVTESCVKQLRKPCARVPELGYALHGVDCGCSPYRVVYDDARAKYTGAVHERPCDQCMPGSNNPAPVGSPLRDGHIHARALRVIGREVLENLWKEARRIHQEQEEGV